MWARAVPYGEFGRLRREASVAWSAGEGSGFWPVSRYADIVAASRDVATYSSSRGVSFEDPTDEDMAARRPIIDTDPPVHTTARTGTCPSAAAARTCAWACTWPGWRSRWCWPRRPAG